MRKLLLLSLTALFSTVMAAADISVQFSYLRVKNRGEDGPWLAKHIFKADRAADADLTVEGEGVEYMFDGFFPAVANISAGSSIVFTVHNTDLAPGEQVSIGTYIGAKGCEAPVRWKCELFDGGSWVAAEAGEESFRCYPGNASPATWYLHTFTLSAPGKGDLKIRCRLLDDVKGPGKHVYLNGSSNTAFCNITSSSVKPKDSLRALFIGNSFTLQRGVVRMFENIAMSQGHALDLQVAVKGGASFATHLRLPLTMDAVAAGGYDVVIMQDLAPAVDEFAKDPVDYHPTLDKSRRLARAVRKASPSAKLILERVWAYPGRDSSFCGNAGFAEFDKSLIDATGKIAADIGAEVCPTGDAFALAREAGLNVYHVDNAHQSLIGGYLKACVLYVYIYGKGFELPVPDCGLDAETANKCREIALQFLK